MWNTFPASVFPAKYNLVYFKRHLLGKRAYTLDLIIAFFPLGLIVVKRKPIIKKSIIFVKHIVRAKNSN